MDESANLSANKLLKKLNGPHSLKFAHLPETEAEHAEDKRKSVSVY
jgi:hypothetical protein